MIRNHTGSSQAAAIGGSSPTHPEAWALVLVLVLLPVIASLAALSSTVCWIVLGWVVMALVVDILFVPSPKR
jgi:hypothetical protein